MTKIAYVIASVASPASSYAFETAYPEAIPFHLLPECNKPAGRNVYVIYMRLDKGESLEGMESSFGADLKIIAAEDAENRSVELRPRNPADHQAIMQDGVAKGLFLRAGMKERSYA